MTSGWKTDYDFEIPSGKRYIIISHDINWRMRKYYEDEEDDDKKDIKFNKDETLTIKQLYPEIRNLKDAFEKYAVSKNMTPEANSYDNNNETTFRPFKIIKYKKDGKVYKTVAETSVFVETLNDKVNIDKTEKVNDLKTIRLFTVETHEALVNLKFWNYKYKVKFALFPKVIFNEKSQVMKLILDCRQIAFEDKKIEYEWRRKDAKKYKNMFKSFLDDGDDDKSTVDDWDSNKDKLKTDIVKMNESSKDEMINKDVIDDYDEGGEVDDELTIVI